MGVILPPSPALRLCSHGPDALSGGQARTRPVARWSIKSFDVETGPLAIPLFDPRHRTKQTCLGQVGGYFRAGGELECGDITLNEDGFLRTGASDFDSPPPNQNQTRTSATCRSEDQ